MRLLLDLPQAKIERTEGAREYHLLLLIERLVPEHEHGIAVHRGVDLRYDRRIEGLAEVDPRHLADKERVDLTYVQSHRPSVAPWPRTRFIRFACEHANQR